MKEQLTVYRAKGKDVGLVFLFKYDLNGNLKAFELEESTLTEAQQIWLFDILHFPSNEIKMKYWMTTPAFSKKFDVEVAPGDISFEAMWHLYDYKYSKVDSIKAYNKLKANEIIKCFIEIPFYLETLKSKPGQATLHLATYINKRRFEDERPAGTIKIGKVFNPVLQELARIKTAK